MKLEFRVPAEICVHLLGYNTTLIERATKIGLNTRLPWNRFYDETTKEYVFVQENTDWSEVTEE